MQIKRFEAADMTEALRLVKRDLGDDAVILSAKEIRPGGFFSALKKKHVEITAAIDYQTKAQPSSTAFTDHLAEQLDEESSADRVSLSARQNGANPGDGDLSLREMQRRSHPRPAIRSEEGRDPLTSGFSGLRGYGAVREQDPPKRPHPGNASDDERPAGLQHRSTTSLLLLPDPSASHWWDRQAQEKARRSSSWPGSVN